MVAHRANRDVTGKEKKTFMLVSLDYIHYLEQLTVFENKAKMSHFFVLPVLADKIVGF